MNPGQAPQSPQTKSPLKADQWKSSRYTAADGQKKLEKSDKINETNKQLDHIQDTTFNRIFLSSNPTNNELQQAIKLAVSTPINGNLDRDTRWELIKNLCELGAKTTDLNSIDANNMTLLHHAARLKYSQAIKVLILKSQNAKPPINDIANQKDSRGNTPLMYATKNEDIETVIALIKIKANPYIANDAGETPLTISVEPMTSALLNT